MRRLTIVRHAKSDWGDFSLADFDRPLNKRGLRDAPKMGARMKARGDAPDLIICSPALRAETTAKLVGESLGYPLDNLQLAETIYEAPVSALLAVAQSVGDEVSHLVMVGHNPGSDQFAQFLTGQPSLGMVTCSVADLDLDVETWGHLGPCVGKLRSYWFPKMFKE